MNFGEILDKWEQGPARTSKNNTRLKDNEVYDKDADTGEESAPGEHRRRLLRSQPDGIIDIHGLTKEKAWLSLDDFFTNARNNGFEKLRIIHGKGNHSQGEAALGRIVREFIEKCPFAGESGGEKAANGGTGATWVLLKD